MSNAVIFFWCNNFPQSDYEIFFLTNKGIYLSWPLTNVKNVAKYFLESEEKHKGHMRGQRQGVRSTRMTEPTEDIPTNIPHQKKGDILITEHEVRSLMYADQTVFGRTIL